MVSWLGAEKKGTFNEQRESFLLGNAGLLCKSILCDGKTWEYLHRTEQMLVILVAFVLTNENVKLVNQLWLNLQQNRNKSKKRSEQLLII